MKLHQSLIGLVSLADPDRVERAIVGLQTGEIVVQVLGTDMGIVTASVHSKDKSYGVMITANAVACACEDHFYRGRGPGGNGKGYLCKHICATIMHLQSLEELQENHFTHKAA